MIISLDIETEGLSVNTDIHYVGVYSIKKDNSELFHAFKFPEEAEDCRTFLNKQLSKNHRPKFVLHNGKFDSVRLLYNYGIDLPIDHDTLILGYLMSTVDELKDIRKKGKWLGLKYMAPRILGVENWDVSKDKKTSTNDEDVIPYLRLDCKYTYELYQWFKIHFPKEKMKTYKLIIKAINAYRDIECNGLPINKDKLEEIKRDVLSQKEIVDKELLTYGDINYNSSKQLVDLLYCKLQIPILRYTEAGQPSTGEDTLKDLLGKHPIIEILLKKRKIEKSLAFLESWSKEMIQHKDGLWYLHSNFNMHGTVTGRTSSSEVNLQQIPRDKSLKTLFQSCDRDWELICLDYSQLELRFAGLVAGVHEIKEAYRRGEDLHYKMASVVTGKPISEITKAERTQAKAANFGFIYGMQAKSFVDYAKYGYGADMDLETAENIRYHFFELYPELLDYYDDVHGTLLTDGKLVSIMQREYVLHPEAIDSNAMRAAVNFPVQSAGSDYVISGLIEVMTDPELRGNIRIGATVHDSIIGLVRKDEHFIDRIKKIKAIMEHPKLAYEMITKEVDLPIIVDVEIGPLGKGVDIDEWLAQNKGVIQND